MSTSDRILPGHRRKTKTLLIVRIYNLNNTDIEQKEENNELDSLISAFTSPVPSHILTDYDNKSKKKHKHGEEQESALEH
jgi:hypothetical protein